MAKNSRNVKGNKIQDQGAILNNQYSQSAGAEKNTEVGRHLVPLNDGAGGFTTNATTAKILPQLGRNLAIYNNGAIASLTLGDSAAVVSLAPGVTDAAGNVGIALKPNDWTYVACNERRWVIASAATALVYLIEDDSFIAQEVATYKGN